MTQIQPQFGMAQKPTSKQPVNHFASTLKTTPADSIDIRFGAAKNTDKAFIAQLPESYQLAIIGAQYIAQEVGAPVTVDKILLSMLDLINQHFDELQNPATPDDSEQLTQAREIYDAVFPPQKFEDQNPAIIQLLLNHGRQKLMEDVHRGAANNGNIKRTNPENIRLEEHTKNFLEYVSSAEPSALKHEVPSAHDFITYLGLKATEEKADLVPDNFKSANVILDDILNTPVQKVSGTAPKTLPDITSTGGGQQQITTDEGGDAASIDEGSSKLLPALYQPGEDTPLLLSEELEDVLKQITGASPVAGQWLLSAINIAGAANDVELSSRHVALAMVRAANALVESKPEYVSAALDTIPLTSTDAPQPFRAQRTTLDALMPPQYRQGMSTPQVQALLNSATAQLESEIYFNESVFTDITADITLSPELNKIMSRLILNMPAQGLYPYALADMLRSSSSNDFGDDVTGQILKNLHENAEKKSGSVPDVKLSDIGGYANEKEELQEFIDLHTNPAMAEALGGTKDIPRGLMFHGPTGTGKTYMAKALANSLGLPFFAYNGSDFVEKYVGVGAKRVREMFKEARKHKEGAVIFIDEIDALLKKRGEATGDTETARTVNAFLAEMDGVLESNPNVIVVGATNLLDSIDEAALRPGRFDRKMKIDNPKTQDRREILDVVFKNKPLADTVDLDRVAKITGGMAGADLDNLASESHLLALRLLNKGERNKLEITAEDIDEARDRIEMGPQSRQEYSEEMLRATANHEVFGHGTVGYALGMTPRTVTTIGRTKSLGHVSFLPDEDREQSLRYVLERVVMMTAGVAAEEVTLGKEQVSMGGGSDYKQARNILTHSISSGQLPGFRATTYENKGDKLSEKDKELMEAVLTRSHETATKMIEVIPKTKQKEIETECMKRIELRNEDATNFFATRFTQAELDKMRAIFDDFVAETVDLLHNNSEANYKKFLGKAQDAQKKGIFGFFRNIASRIADFFKNLFRPSEKPDQAIIA